MNLFDVFRKSKKASASCHLGSMWACVVKCKPRPDSGYWYDVVIKNVGIVEAFVHGDETRVTSDERNPFSISPICLAGPVGHLEYVKSLHVWIGFFGTEDEVKEKYRLFAADLERQIETASRRLFQSKIKQA